MSRPLRMDEMGLGVLSRDLEASRMSNEAPTDEDVAARVRAAITGDFQPEQVNSFPMKLEKGCLDLVSTQSYFYLTSVIWLCHSSSCSSCAHTWLPLGDDQLPVLEASGEGGSRRP